MRIDIFCEGGEKYGLGHIKRSEAIAKRIIELFIGLDFDLHTHIHTKKEAPQWKYDGEKYDICIVDSYFATIEFYVDLFENSKALICLDDYARLKYPGFVINPAPNSSRLYDNEDKIFASERYAPIRGISKKQKQRSKIKNVLLTLGGSMQNSLLEEMADILDSLNLTPIIFSPHFQSEKYQVHRDKIDEVIQKCDIAICSGGMTLQEIAYSQTPIIAMQIAQNQSSQLDGYAGKIITIQSPSQLAGAIEKMQTLKGYFFEELKKLKISQGLDEALRYIISPFRKYIFGDVEAIEFRNLDSEKLLEILDLRNQPHIRENSKNNKLISQSQHLEFVKNIGWEERFFGFYKNQTLLGVGSLNMRKKTSTKTATIGIYKSTDGRGSVILDGIFSIAKELEVEIVVLEVLVKNCEAIGFYKKNGFKEISRTQKIIKMQRSLKWENH